MTFKNIFSFLSAITLTLVCASHAFASGPGRIIVNPDGSTTAYPGYDPEYKCDVIEAEYNRLIALRDAAAAERDGLAKKRDDELKALQAKALQYDPVLNIIWTPDLLAQEWQAILTEYAKRYVTLSDMIDRFNKQIMGLSNDLTIGCTNWRAIRIGQQIPVIF